MVDGSPDPGELGRMSERPEFVVAAVAGVTLTRWTRAWDERRRDRALQVDRVDESQQTAVVLDGAADVVFARRPFDEEGLSAIPLYEELQVVVAAVGHVFEAVAEIAASDLAGENDLEHTLRTAGPEAAIELVATGIGVVVVPHSIARLFARKDVISRPIVDAAPTRISLVWVTAAMSDDIEEFIGIVRGRTAHSSRSVATAPAAKPARGSSRGSPRKASAPRNAEGRRGRGRGRGR